MKSGAVFVDARMICLQNPGAFSGKDDDVEAVADGGILKHATGDDVSTVIFKVKDLFPSYVEVVTMGADTFLLGDGDQRVLNDGKAAALDENDAEKKIYNQIIYEIADARGSKSRKKPGIERRGIMECPEC